MQRLYFGFPDGRSGVALLLLRCALSAYLVGVGIRDVSIAVSATSGDMVVSVLCAAAGVLSLSGLLTPVVSLMIIGSQALVLLGSPRTTSGDWLLSVLVTAVALSLVLLGPGAYSVDNYLFGRRVINIRRPIGVK